MLSAGEFRTDPNFGFEVPLSCAGIDDTLLTPRETWADGIRYDVQANKLVDMFANNFQKYVPFIDKDVKAAAIG